VLCEKPLALTVAEVDAMIAAARKGRRKLMCAQHMRFQEDSQTMKEYFQKHPLGDVYYARAWYLRRRGIPGTPGFIYKKNSGGGCLIDVGVHILDLTMFMMDNFRPVSVTGVGGKMLCGRSDTWSEWAGRIDNKGMDVEDFAAGMIRFASGAAMSLECSFALNMKPRWEVRLDLFGTEAGASWPAGDVATHTSRGFVNTGLTFREGGEEPHRAVIAAFARSVIDNKPVPVPPEQTRAVIGVLEGLYKSMKTGREVRL
jgi:predicted dehydrogenase